MKTGRLFSLPKDERGVAAIVVALGLFMLLGFGALAIDLSHIYVARNELKNATDAGALAGARFLYNREDGTVDTGANQRACDAARDNRSENVVVEVNCSQTADGVERGHWSFTTRTFTANPSTAPVDLWDRSWAVLDADPNFINAVRVTARREATQIASYFATLFGYTGFRQSRDSVAYIGFAGTLEPQDVDQPIAICKQSIIQPPEGPYTCTTGRMLDSGGGTTHNSGAWTNFSQPCETASPPTVRPLVCGDGNPNVITLGEGMGTTGGVTDNVYRRLRDCWLELPDMAKDSRDYPVETWSLTLPVIDCPDNNPGPCSRVVGAVSLDVLWIKQPSTDPPYSDIPLQMEGWECSIWVDAGRPLISSLSVAQRVQCWSQFATTFNLRTADGTSVAALTPPQLQKTIFFSPSCEPHEPRGVTGGDNFGILAEIPVLVQ